MSRGPQCREDVERSLAAGVSGTCTNHEARVKSTVGQLPFTTSQEVAEAVDKRVPIVFDSGIRRGQHAFKALASGADLVAIAARLSMAWLFGGSWCVKSLNT